MKKNLIAIELVANDKWGYLLRSTTLGPCKLKKRDARVNDFQNSILESLAVDVHEVFLDVFEKPLLLITALAVLHSSTNRRLQGAGLTELHLKPNLILGWRA